MALQAMVRAGIASHGSQTLTEAIYREACAVCTSHWHCQRDMLDCRPLLALCPAWAAMPLQVPNYQALQTLAWHHNALLQALLHLRAVLALPTAELIFHM